MPHHSCRAVPAALAAAVIVLAAAPIAAQVQGPGLQAPTRLVAPGAERGVIIISGRVIKVEGDAVTLRDSAGRDSTLSSPLAAELQPGDSVVIENGVLRKGR